MQQQPTQRVCWVVSLTGQMLLGRGHAARTLRVLGHLLWVVLTAGSSSRAPGGQHQLQHVPQHSFLPHPHPTPLKTKRNLSLGHSTPVHPGAERQSHIFTPLRLKITPHPPTHPHTKTNHEALCTLPPPDTHIHTQPTHTVDSRKRPPSLCPPPSLSCRSSTL